MDGCLKRFRLAGLALLCALPAVSQSLPFVSPIFGDYMVLQRGRANTIWGWSSPGDRVRVEISGRVATATAGADGKWEASIQPPPVGGPYALKISGAQTVELQDVLVGDVWLAAGQSNMQFGLGEARNGAEEIRNANHPQMRYFVVGQRSAYAKVEVPRGDVAVDESGDPRIERGLSSAIRQSDVRIIALALIVFTPVPLLQSWRFKVLLKAQEIHLTYWECVKLSFGGNFLNFVFLMGTTAGDVFKAYYTSLHTHHKTEAVTTVNIGVKLPSFFREMRSRSSAIMTVWMSDA